jgi:hypothetical protein
MMESNKDSFSALGLNRNEPFKPFLSLLFWHSYLIIVLLGHNRHGNAHCARAVLLGIGMAIAATVPSPSHIPSIINASVYILFIITKRSLSYLKFIL